MNDGIKTCGYISDLSSIKIRRFGRNCGDDRLCGWGDTQHHRARRIAAHLTGGAAKGDMQNTPLAVIPQHQKVSSEITSHIVSGDLERYARS
jgi:hypothetical protein